MFLLTILFDFFFFFQAEDGIRDHCVTGVQTCALPISRRRTVAAPARARAGAATVRRRAALRPMRRRVRVLIVEGSAVTRRVLSAILAADRELEVAGAVAGVQDAHEAMARLRPDVVTLDAAILSRRGLASLERL